jgi:L-aminopeptidase/D-esterase-like protein
VITDVAGVRVGHWTDAEAATGCTVVLFPDGTVASGEVRGGAPATREFDLLDPARTVARIDALLLTGGSAFGLAAADGVMRWCEERGVGFPTPAGPVPIVVALALFDLMTGDPRVRPGADAGYAACVDAVDAAAGDVPTGAVGAGTGATIAGPDDPGRLAIERPPREPGGIVTASVRVDDVVVAALVVVNAAGRPGDPSTTAVARARAALAAAAAAADAGGAIDAFDAGPAAAAGPAVGAAPGREQTVIGLVATNARLDKLGCLLVAQGAHDGLARAVFPPHTASDGDAFVAAATGTVPGDADTVRMLAVHVVAEAIGSLAGRGPSGSAG